MIDSNLQKEPHTFPDIRAAVAALAGFVGEWSSLLQFDLVAVHEGGERAFAGYQVRAKDLDGFGVGYVRPRATPAESLPVVVTLDAGADRLENVASFATITEAEAFLGGPGIDPEALHAGRYGIDAPHGVADSQEAYKTARALGFEFLYLTTREPVEVYYSRPNASGAENRILRGPFTTTEAAALAALATVEP